MITTLLEGRDETIILVVEAECGIFNLQGVDMGDCHDQYDYK